MTPDEIEDLAYEMHRELARAEQREIDRRVERARAERSHMTTNDRLDEIEARHRRNAVPDAHPESHDCRGCSDARDIGALIAVVRAVQAVVAEHQGIHDEWRIESLDPTDEECAEMGARGQILDELKAALEGLS